MTQEKKNTPEGKFKATYYLENVTEELLVEIYMKRIKEGKRVRKSTIVDEAIKSLHKNEFSQNS